MTEAMDDDEDGCGNIGTNRYQATPSLQALQQMRNRLHTAFLGKRLMKWTALATGKELRKISGLLNIAQEPTFTEEFVKAMMLLARCRYHNTEFNKVLLQNVEKKPAYVTCTTNSKHVAGKKVILLEMHTEGPQSQPYTALSRGGEIIKKTRVAWLELLRHFLQILELRSTFIVVYRTNQEATKKKNVMGKIVIPKTINTIRYILNELEELEREDFFRLKKIKNLKIRRKPETRRKREYYGHSRKICSHVCMDECKLDTRKVCHSCMTGDPTLAVDCQDENAFVCDTCEAKPQRPLREYLDEVIAITKAIDQGSNYGDIRQELSQFFHNFAMMEKSLIQEQCPGNNSLMPSKFEVAPVIPSKHSKMKVDAVCTPIRSTTDKFRVTSKGSQFDTPSVKQLKSTYYEDLPYLDKVSDELIEGYFETEYKEITKVRRTKGEDGKIKEETEIIRQTTRIKFPDELCADAVKGKEKPEVRIIPNKTEAKKLTALNSRAQSSICLKSSNLTVPSVRPCVSWSVEPSNKLASQSFVDKLKNVQTSSARKGVVMLPGEMSNLMSEPGGSKDTDKDKVQPKQQKKVVKTDSKSRHERCFK